MPTITKKELEDYRQMCYDKNNGRILTPDGVRLICEAYKMTRKPSENICWRRWLGFKIKEDADG